MKMLETLFSSRVRARLLTAFFVHPGSGFNARQLTLDLDESYSAIWKELVRLEQLGILASKAQGNAKVYALNPDCPVNHELRMLVLKTDGIGSAVQQMLPEMPGIQAAFIYGSFASGEADPRSDLDLMFIGDIDLPHLSGLIARLEHDLKRPVNYLIFTAAEWQEKIAKGDPFLNNVLNEPKIWLVGADQKQEGHHAV